MGFRSLLCRVIFYAVFLTTFGCQSPDVKGDNGSTRGSHPIAGNPKAAFWTVQRRGANFFNNADSLERFEAAKAISIDLVRLAPNKWLNGRPPRERGDFLLRLRDAYESLIESDVAALRRVLDDAERAGVKVVVTMLSLPGHRWSQ
jgi:endoglucanase